jgi:hypothetical protein
MVCRDDRMRVGTAGGVGGFQLPIRLRRIDASARPFLKG